MIVYVVGISIIWVLKPETHGGSDIFLSMPVMGTTHNHNFPININPPPLEIHLTLPKKRIRPLEIVVRDIILDSDRFYKPDRRRRRVTTSEGESIDGSEFRKRTRSFLWDSTWSRNNSGLSRGDYCSIESIDASCAGPDCQNIDIVRIEMSKICKYDNPMFKRMGF